MKKLRIPSKIRIGAIEYNILDVDMVVIDDRIGFSGAIDYNEAIIELLNGVEEQRRLETFFHELLHGMYVEAGFETHDEGVIERVGKIFYQVMKDNYFYDEEVVNER